jgi:broad specificity phosphatase PhoE
MMRRRGIAIAIVTMVALAVPARASAQKLIFLVRHAERADAGTTPQADPPLSSAGQARAQKLAAMLADAGITSIVTTELVRTQQTAAPLATKLGVTPETVAADNPTGVVATLKISHGNEIVLVVGHSDTLPAILKAYGKADVAIADSEYDNLFIIVPATGTFTRLRY